MNKEVKRRLRLEYKAKRSRIPADEKRERDLKITQTVLNSAFYAEAREVLCYVSTDDEIDTKGIISDALSLGKKVFVPKCTEQKGIMRFYQITSFDDLKLGKFNIPEPLNSYDDNEWQHSGKKVLCIVPALCCDRFGNRLGYGGGYYDRFLSGFDGKKLCLCYACFADVQLPLDEHDVFCDEVIKG